MNWLVKPAASQSTTKASFFFQSLLFTTPMAVFLLALAVA